ncbi:hypothetical protein HAX54_044693 [Datura stramonium]|uniref:Uncharacterized protein n=1 Tax=Datura stramonium TaxID=4076 RepID=A0ABS8WH41_DATST|nr:hypothetical protein [Datura stramonium]
MCPEERQCNGKRKDQGIGEPEGSRKRRKASSHRPACSWVHFSRDFIKEYSATHPESSGLKAEKAKATTRAREVWDKYLSSTPARAPKPRRQEAVRAWGLVASLASDVGLFEEACVFGYWRSLILVSAEISRWPREATRSRGLSFVSPALLL